MEIIGPRIDIQLLAKLGAEKLSSEFRVGQILKAIAQDTTPDGLLQLRVGRQLLQARSPLPIAPGARLTLLVEDGDDQPRMRILDPPRPEAVRIDALRKVLPRMLNLAPALGRVLSAGAGAGATPAPALAEETRELIQTLARLLPTTSDVASGQGLKAAVQQSGLFKEAMLGLGRVPSADVKTALGRMAARLHAESALPGRPALPSPAASGAATPSAAAQQQLPGSPVTTRPAHAPQATATAGAQQAMAKPAAAAATSDNARPTAPYARPSAPAMSGNPPVPAASHPMQKPDALPLPTAQRIPAENATRPVNPSGPPKAGNQQVAGQPSTPAGREMPGKAAMPNPARLPLPSPIPPGSHPPARPGAPPAGPEGAAHRGPVATSTAQTQATGQAVMVGRQMPPQVPSSQDQNKQPSAPPAAESPVARLVKELAGQVEGALSRIQYHQLTSLPPEDPARQVWQLELPLRNGEHLDAFQLRVEEEKAGIHQDDGGSVWRVDLAFDLAPLGPMRVRIGLQGEKVSSVFWAERVQTVSLIERRMQELSQGLERVGLEVGRLSAHRGVPPATKPEPDESTLLDEQA